MRPLLRKLAVGLLVATATATTATATASAAPIDRYLDLPLINRDAGHGPGGVNPVLPTDPVKLRALLGQARASGVAPTRYQALLWQYWLADTTTAAGINLASWNPRDGVSANRANLVKSYRFYENLQLSHRELQWAGMGGLVGADFGGGLLDFELATNVYDFTRLAPVANAIVAQTNQVLGPVFVDKLPRGLRALARVGAKITPADLRKIQGDILIMQKNIFSDLMPMHRAYVVGGLPALAEMNRAGLFSDEIMAAWTAIASKSPDGIAAGNARLLRREQGEVIKKQWDATRAYKGDVGYAMTYASTAAGSPSVAGVVAPRSFRPITISGIAPNGRPAELAVPLPSWNWSVYPDRWAYITDQLLPKYRDQVEHRWPQLRATLLIPYDQQIESHRPMWNLLPMMQSALQTLKVTYK
ncbi:hypothetical protein HUN08_02635 [Gordonia sp. X0973]|uniref:hypothetical protein n=1 Tax=Gordonia sp. X0973 TaxID=2742602 RepID=UPI000F52C565|nr:hypothetical protein [Gordonia sp. X0973]QKT06210.1 hypothetical protein HUN08_02635 [Gordonia sp. X0973]